VDSRSGAQAKMCASARLMVLVTCRTLK